MRFCIFAVLLFCTALRAEEYRADFDADAAGWSSESGAAVRRGTYPGGKSGALFFSAPARFVSPVIPLKPGERYELDRTGRLISVPGMYRTLEQLWLATRFERRFVLPMTIPFDTSKEGGRIRIAVNKTGKEKNWVDDVVIRKVASRNLQPTEPMPAVTPPLMLTGPDGVRYPNWKLAGIRGPFPEPKLKFSVRDFGAVPDDRHDDTAAIERACAAAEKNGGVVLFGEGTYILTRKILISRDGVVLRGAGRNRTRIVFELPESQVGLYPVSIGPNISAGTKCVVVFPAENAKRVSVAVGDREILKRDADSFLPADRIFRQTADGYSADGKASGDGSCYLCGWFGAQRDSAVLCFFRRQFFQPECGFYVQRDSLFQSAFQNSRSE